MGTGAGPPYPHPNPVPGSNGIGFFIIGVSPIGDIAAFDFWQTVVSQYANSPILTTLINNFFQYIDPTTNLDSFFDLIWNVDTAVGYGLDVWGRIVGVQRSIRVPGVQQFFGFNEPSFSYAGFNQEPFYSGTLAVTNVSLSDSDFRTLIFAKALANISNGSIPAINQILLNLFPNRGNVFVVDNENMTITYQFNFVLTQAQLAMLFQSGVLVKPAGVQATIVQIP